MQSRSQERGVQSFSNNDQCRLQLVQQLQQAAEAAGAEVPRCRLRKCCLQAAVQLKPICAVV